MCEVRLEIVTFTWRFVWDDSTDSVCTRISVSLCRFSLCLSFDFVTVWHQTFSSEHANLRSASSSFIQTLLKLFDASGFIFGLNGNQQLWQEVGFEDLNAHRTLWARNVYWPYVPSLTSCPVWAEIKQHRPLHNHKNKQTPTICEC